MAPSLPSDILKAVELHGHWFLADTSPEDAIGIVRQLGEVLFVTNVTVKPGKALVTSDRALDFHTDHHRADLICWYCIEQTDQGGETLLLDCYNAPPTGGSE